MPCIGPSQMDAAYFLHNDTETGWDEAYFFSFFAQVNRESHTLPYVEAAVMGVLMATGLLENVVVGFTILYFKRLRLTANLFIVNLALSSVIYMLIGAFVISARLNGSWTTGKWSCQFTCYLVLVSGCVSLWTQMLIAYDKYRKIVSHGVRRWRRRTVFLLCLMTWLVNGTFLIPAGVYALVIPTHPAHQISSKAPVFICTFSMPYYAKFRWSYLLFAYIVGFGYIIPLILIMFAYGRILSALHQSSDCGKVHTTASGTKHVVLQKNVSLLRLNSRGAMKSATSFGESNIISSQPIISGANPVFERDDVFSSDDGHTPREYNVYNQSKPALQNTSGLRPQTIFKFDLKNSSKDSSRSVNFSATASGNSSGKDSRPTPGINGATERVHARQTSQQSLGMSHFRNNAGASNGSAQGNSAVAKSSNNRHRKSVRILVALVLTFFGSWIPIFFVIGWVQVETDFNCYNVSSTVFFWVLALSFLNACTNPFLYGFVSENFKVAISEIFSPKSRDYIENYTPSVETPR